MPVKKTRKRLQGLMHRGGIIHVANIKGGVGKSTVATNLAACLSRHGRTLVVDLDVQGSASIALGHEPDEMQDSVQGLQIRFRSGQKGITYLSQIDGI